MFTSEVDSIGDVFRGFIRIEVAKFGFTCIIVLIREKSIVRHIHIFTQIKTIYSFSFTFAFIHKRAISTEYRDIGCVFVVSTHKTFAVLFRDSYFKHFEAVLERSELVITTTTTFKSFVEACHKAPTFFADRRCY